MNFTAARRLLCCAHCLLRFELADGLSRLFEHQGVRDAKRSLALPRRAGSRRFARFTASCRTAGPRGARPAERYFLISRFDLGSDIVWS